MGAAKERHLGLTTSPSGMWVQTERRAHEQWAKLIAANPKAAALMHVIIANMGRHNALVASQKTLAGLVGCTVRTVQRSSTVLRDGNWIEVRQIGPTGTACAYIVNDRVAWSGNREGIRYSLYSLYSLFTAAVLMSSAEQPDAAELGEQEDLQKLPALFPGEQQLPTGPGLEPPSQPAIEGMEHDLPARQRDEG